MVVDETSAKFGEHRAIKSGVRKFQAQQIFPVEPSAHRICCLLIGQVLHKLHHGD
jgi:hypothetical protein